MNDVRIGVDLGTRYSSVGYNDHHGMHFIQDPAAPQLTYSIPSCALIREDNNRFVFGELAESEKNVAPEGYKSEFKRDLGSSIPYRLHDRRISAAELTAEFLAFLVALTTTTLDATPASAVITVPAAYDQFRRSLINEAARHAGLPGISLVAEPVAAVISAAERGEITGDTTILVYDLGGGTFDAAVVRLNGGKQTVLGAKGLADFGGTDIDRLIGQDFARKAGDEFAAILAGQDTDDPKLVARARRTSIAAEDFCRKIKHRLSSADHASDVLNLQFDYALSRRELEDMVRPDLDRTISTCRQLLAGIPLTPDQIDTVLLVGGASRMPMVREILAKELGRPVRRAADPELAVCVGAAILARTTARTASRQAQGQASWESQEAGKQQAEEDARTETRERPERGTEEQVRRHVDEQVADLQAAVRRSAAVGSRGAVLDVSAQATKLDAREGAGRRARDEAELGAREMGARSTGRGGDPAAARDQFAALVPVRERVSGAEHPDTLITRHSLAYWTGQAGDAAAARDQLAALVPVRERVLGGEDPDTLTTRHNFAYWTGQAGDAAAARDQIAALVPVRERVLGGEDPDTLSARYNLAYWTGQAGDPAAARDQLAALVPVRERVLGARHPDTLIARRELARWAGEAGDPAGARDQLAALLPVVKRALGAAHPDVAAAQRQLDHWASKATGRAGVG